MPTDATQVQLSIVVAELLPFLRRYARALTGSQKTGDRLAAMTLEGLLADRTGFDTASSHRVALYAGFHKIWNSLGRPIETDSNDASIQALKHLSFLTENSREALLLQTVEEFETSQVAEIMEVTVQEVEKLVQVAVDEMERSVAGDIMIIEDEAIIALHIKQVVTELGHDVTGIARKESEAISLASQKRPSLILSDIQLADGSSGVDAVNEILKVHGDIPVIFITAFPERLLTGERPEPAFLITKPYSEDQVRSAVSQAMFFATSAGITVT